MDNLSKITFGTWGLSEWENYSQDYCKEICNLAYRKGIKSFDTALVYGNGKAEELLSFLPRNCFIATKIPAKNKSKELSEAYDSAWIKDCIDQSRKFQNLYTRNGRWNLFWLRIDYKNIYRSTNVIEEKINNYK